MNQFTHFTLKYFTKIYLKNKKKLGITIRLQYV